MHLLDYSNSDLTQLCREASFYPVRDIPPTQIGTTKPENIRPINNNGFSSSVIIFIYVSLLDYTDFVKALDRVRPSVSVSLLRQFEDWNKQFAVH